MSNMETMDEKALVSLFMGGNVDAYGVLAQRSMPGLQRFMTKITKDFNEAEELAQEAVVRAFTNISNFRGDCSFVVWLSNIAKNLFVDKTRSKAVTHRIDMQDLSTAKVDNQDIFKHEVSDELLQAIDMLPEKLKKIMTLRYIEGVNPQRVAELMGVSVNNVRVSMNRACGKLRLLLADKKESIYA